ncbi:hypothetical protein G6O69_24525 [Pseudenhygromyxa sp. WMMC2535]|uniref:hypothetical protein n=1 Tax=Pseudenhygromyxa sp. WMMC2535 TaxID=2712867 RepID=UPI001553A1E1|nr:hypothetical protein [Pseudenhygromyxa sp. WMMC2535]NVB41029.1 hypothetical protein [Pseudenhygromyxa sp. WMMC2535]
MFITIAAAITVASATILPAAAEVVRIVEERNNPIRQLAVPTRRSQVEGKKR